MRDIETQTKKRMPWWIGLLGFLAIILPFQWEEHKAHILGVLPYLLLLACPLLHFFMHGGHGEHGSKGEHQHPAEGNLS